MFGKDEAWANVTFETFDEAKEAYEQMKKGRIFFKEA